MKYTKWVLLILFTAVLGFLVIGYLTVHPLEMSTYLFRRAIVGFAIIVLLAHHFAKPSAVRC
jgi:hypothetical protein